MAKMLTVIIPTHGRPTLLRRALDSLGDCVLPESYRETIVVENGSRDGAEAVVASAATAHPSLRLRYMHVDRPNKSHALNQALDTIEQDALVVFFDDDITIDPATLVAYEEAATTYPQSAFFGGSLDVDQEKPAPYWLEPSLPASAVGWDGSEATRRSAGFLGANWAAYVGEIIAAGGFDPRYGPGRRSKASGSETTMQKALRTVGSEPVYVAGATVRHYVPRTSISVRWVLKRKYRAGIERGAEARCHGTFVARRELRATARLTKSLALRAVQRHPVARMSALAALIKQAGFWRGYFRSIKRDRRSS